MLTHSTWEWPDCHFERRVHLSSYLVAVTEWTYTVSYYIAWKCGFYVKISTLEILNLYSRCIFPQKQWFTWDMFLLLEIHPREGVVCRWHDNNSNAIFGWLFCVGWFGVWFMLRKTISFLCVSTATYQYDSTQFFTAEVWQSSSRKQKYRETNPEGETFNFSTVGLLQLADNSRYTVKPISICTG